MKYQIQQVGPSKTIEGKYGQLVIYTIKLQNENDWVELSQKPDSPVPTVGQELEGNIENSQYGKRFKKDFAARGGGGFSNKNTDKQIALQAASNVAENIQDTLVAAEMFLHWLQSDTATQKAINDTPDKGEYVPTEEDLSDLGL